MFGITDEAPNLSHSELSEMVMEIVEWHKNSILVDGKLRRFADKLQSDWGVPAVQKVKLAETMVLEEAAIRFVSLNKLVNGD